MSETTPHPKALAAYNRARRSKEIIQNKRERLESVTHSFGLRFVHLRPDDENTTGATIAYNFTNKHGRRVINVAIAIQHPKDVFCKWMGRYVAAMQHDEGAVITLRVPKNLSIPTFLKNTFGLTTVLDYNPE